MKAANYGNGNTASHECTNYNIQYKQKYNANGVTNSYMHACARAHTHAHTHTHTHTQIRVWHNFGFYSTHKMVPKKIHKNVHHNFHATTYKSYQRKQKEHTWTILTLQLQISDTGLSINKVTLNYKCAWKNHILGLYPSSVSKNTS
jgi:hypothetical protein